jgi:spore coat polysaccharide biosynthesis protein SpsF (cytidylyltransferase family)
MSRIVAIMPIKLNNERLPGKNVKMLGGKPLLQHELDMLLQLEELESINVYCSDEVVCRYLPKGALLI